MRGLDYNDEKWDALLDQLTPSDYQPLMTQSGYGPSAIKSVDKPSTTDSDTATGLVNYGFDAGGKKLRNWAERKGGFTWKRTPCRC